MRNSSTRGPLLPIALIALTLVGPGCGDSNVAMENGIAQESDTAESASIMAVESGTRPSEREWQVSGNRLIGEWEYVPFVPKPDNPAIFKIDDNRLVVVRTSNGGTEVAAYTYDLSTGTVTPAAHSGFPWTSASAVVWTGKEVYIGPGNNNSSPPPTPPLKYDPAADTWEQIAIDMVAAEAAMAAGGGPGIWTGSEIVYVEAGLALDPERGTWRTIARFPLSGRVAATAVWTGQELVVWGGCDRSIDQCDDMGQGLFRLSAFEMGVAAVGVRG